MDPQNTCQELFLDDVVRIDVYAEGQYNVPVPPTVANLSTLAPFTLGTPAFSAAIDESAAVPLLSSNVTVKTTHDTQRAGHIFKHEITSNIYIGHDEARQKVFSLLNRDAIVILTTADAARLLFYPVPHTFAPSVDETRGATHEQTIKFTLQSMSSVISIR